MGPLVFIYILFFQYLFSIEAYLMNLNVSNTYPQRNNYFSPLKEDLKKKKDEKQRKETFRGREERLLKSFAPLLYKVFLFCIEKRSRCCFGIFTRISETQAFSCKSGRPVKLMTTHFGKRSVFEMSKDGGWLGDVFLDLLEITAVPHWNLWDGVQITLPISAWYVCFFSARYASTYSAKCRVSVALARYLPHSFGARLTCRRQIYCHFLCALTWARLVKEYIKTCGNNIAQLRLSGSGK